MTVVRNPMNPNFFVESKEAIIPIGPYEVQYEIDGNKIKEKVFVLVKKIPDAPSGEPPEDSPVEIIEIHDFNGKRHEQEDEIIGALWEDPKFGLFALDALDKDLDGV